MHVIYSKTTTGMPSFLHCITTITPTAPSAANARVEYAVVRSAPLVPPCWTVPDVDGRADDAACWVAEVVVIVTGMTVAACPSELRRARASSARCQSYRRTANPAYLVVWSCVMVTTGTESVCACADVASGAAEPLAVTVTTTAEPCSVDDEAGATELELVLLLELHADEQNGRGRQRKETHRISVEFADYGSDERGWRSTSASCAFRCRLSVASCGSRHALPRHRDSFPLFPFRPPLDSKQRAHSPRRGSRAHGASRSGR